MGGIGHRLPRLTDSRSRRAGQPTAYPYQIESEVSVRHSVHEPLRPFLCLQITANPSVKDPKQECKLLTQLERVYTDTERVARSNLVLTGVFTIAGISLMILGMYLSKSGVIQGLCDILVCLSGFCLAYAFFYYGMNRTNPLLKRYTQLDREQLAERISTLRQ